MVYQAGLISFFRTILIIVGIYLAFKLLFRYLIPYLLKYILKRQQSHFYNEAGSGKEGRSDAGKDKRRKKDKDRLGDYIDYEEVEE